MKRLILYVLAFTMLITTASAVFSKDGSVVSDDCVAIYGGRSADNLRGVVIASPSVIVEPLIELESFEVYDLSTFEKLEADLPYLYTVDELTGEDLTEYPTYDPHYIDTAGEYLIEYSVAGDEPTRINLVVVSGFNFPDTAGHWASGEIAYSADHGWFYGTDDGLFAPDSPITRAQAVTVLWRICGNPVPRIWTENPDYRPFLDVPPGEYYTEAVTWAMSVEIASGTGNGFEPNRPVTRAEFAALLLRTQHFLNPIESHETTDGFYSAALDTDHFSDGGAIESWSRPAIGWAYLHDVLRGDDKGTLRPNASVTRAEAAAMLFRAR